MAAGSLPDELRHLRWQACPLQLVSHHRLDHITALIALVGILMLLGGIGLSVTPGTAGWWLARPLWVVLLIATLAPILAIFMRFEAAPPTPPERAPGPARALIGALVTCAGLIAIALQGIGSGNALGINVIAVALVVVGVTVATRPTGPTGAST